jgi:hypothetical protein
MLKELPIRQFLAALIGSYLLAALGIRLSYSQVKSQETETIRGIRRTLPLKEFYDTPNPLPLGKPGDLIRSEEVDEYNLPLGIVAVRILYHSRSAIGHDIAVSGVVLYPERKAPSGGWPVIAWAHALNGVARQCAPSLARNVQHGPILSMYVNLGYAVVATDYAGLGSNFRNAFADAPSNASDVIYSVPAARVAVPQLGPRWIAIGIGLGGAAVIGVAELGKEIRDSNYLGSIAISQLENPDDRYGGTLSFYETPLFLAYGIRTVYPEFDLREVLTDKALALYPRVEQACGEPGAESKLSWADLLKPDWASNKFVRQYFSRNTQGRRPAQGPILIIASELDSHIPISRTAQVITQMCKQGDRIQFEQYPQSDTERVFGDSVREQIAWIQARFAGERATSNCSAQR